MLIIGLKEGYEITGFVPPDKDQCFFDFLSEVFLRKEIKKGLQHSLVLHQSEEGYSVSCPGLPGCWSQGATEEEALTNIRIAIREYVEAAEEIARSEEGRVVEVAVA